MSKLLLLSIVWVTLTTQLFSQQVNNNTGIIKGIVTTSDGHPAAEVTVRIEKSRWGTVTNGEGQFVLNNIKPGNWMLKISAIGAVSQEKVISVTAGETLNIVFSLKENAEQLDEVVIASKNLNKRDDFVGKMPLKNLENPQVYGVVSSAVIKQQAITNYDDVMRNVPGIVRTWESTGRAGDGGAYFALRGFDAQPVLYNGLPGLVSGNLDLANTEEVQIIKGPSGTLFGGSFYSYGGLINTITKKPYFTTGGEIGYNFGSFGLNRVTADFNTPLSKTEKIAMRVNTAYHAENSFQDAGFKKSFFIAPSLTYEVNERLSFQFFTEILNEERAVAPIFFQSDRISPLPFKTVEELNLNNKLSFTSNDLTIKNPRYSLQGQMLYKLSDKWTSQTVFARGTVKSDGIYGYIWDDVSGDNWFSHYVHKEQQTTNTTDIQQNFNGDFKIGGLRNRLLVGLDYFNRNIIDNGTGYAWVRNITPQGDVDYVDPFTGDSMPPVYLTQSSIDNLLANTGVSNSNITNSSYSAYFSDVLNITPRLMAMISLRADYFDSNGERTDDEDDFDQFALSPRVGLLYQAIQDKVSLFVNYIDGFTNVAPMQVGDPDGQNLHIKSFKAEHANQLEYGVKTNLFSNKLAATISVYDIKVSNRVTVDPDNRFNYVQGGKVGSKGFEFDISAYPVAGLGIIAGYSYNETKVIVGDKDDFYSEPGRSPGGQGPQNLFNLWGTYKFTGGKLKDFGVGLGGNYASDYKVIDNANTGVFILPAYTLIHASLFYNVAKYRISLNVNNIGNEVYYSGYWSINPQRPRNFVMSLAYIF